MTLLGIRLQPGESIFTQVAFASQKAIVLGKFSPGQAFPSVRALAADLHIHPKTAHKVIQHLINEGWLEVRPGIGTVVGAVPPSRQKDRKRFLGPELEQVVLEAKRLGVSLHELVQALSNQWTWLDKVAGEQDE
jgi:GntR family transcriptional regulator